MTAKRNSTSWSIPYSMYFFFIYRPENEKSLSSETSSTDVKSFFSNCNVAALRQLGGGRVLLDLCLSLPEFAKIIESNPASSSSLMSLTSSRWVLQRASYRKLFSNLICHCLLQNWTSSQPVIVFTKKKHIFIYIDICIFLSLKKL